MGMWMSYDVIGTTVVIAVMFFSACMFWDCIKRSHEDFTKRFSKDGQHEKVIWLFLIIFGVKLFGIAAIAYYILERDRKVQFPWSK